MLRIKLSKWPRLAGKRYKHMVTLRWQWYSTQRGNTHKHANIRTEIQGWTYMLFILHFPANFFWLTESTVLVSHWSQLIRCYAIDRAWLVERVFTEGATVSCCITCWVFASTWVVCVCCLVLWESVPTPGRYLHICIYQGAVCQCSSPFYCLCLCAPLSSYITHNYPQERDNTHPLGTDAFTYRAHKQNNKERSLWTCRQRILFITSSSAASYVL